ncbi:MAG: hypothetical protein AAFR58_03135 [Cyanobacteria bacterium J06627_28]
MNPQSLVSAHPSPNPPQSELLTAPSLSAAGGEPLRHILLGTPGGIRQTIHLLHTLRYVENALWSPLIPIPDGQLIISPRQGEVMSLLVRQV